MTTLGDAYIDLRNAFRERGLSVPELAAKELLCLCVATTKTELAANRGSFISDQTLSNVWRMAERYMNGEPLAYILEQWDFYGLRLTITPDVLIPRPDTETLARMAIEILQRSGNPKVRVLDLCCGSGCVGLAVAVNVSRAEVTLSDISPEALRLAERNAVTIGAEVRCMAADALGPPLPALGRFDMIVCNPPYISDAEYEALDISVRGYEPALALRGGADGLDFYRAVIRHWNNALAPGGALLFEAGFGQAPAITEMMRFSGLISVTAERDLNGIERVVMGYKYL